MNAIKLLVRDKVPEGCTKRGVATDSEIITDDESYLNMIKCQIQNICKSSGFTIDDVCDIYDLLDEARRICGYSDIMFNNTRNIINDEFGGYSRRICLTNIKETK